MATIELTGDFAALDALAESFGGMAALRSEISEQLSEEAVDLIKEGFRQQSDPFGRRWRPKQRDDGRAILTGPTGAMRNSYKTTSLGPDGFTVSSSVDYSTYHQGGTRFMVARKMVPDRFLPPKWERNFVETVEDTLEAHFG